jgi:hypothetical protein
MKKNLLISVLILFVCAIAFQAIAEEMQTETEEESHSRIIIYPILLQAPLFGADVRSPSVGDGGGDETDEVDRSTGFDWDAAFLAGVSIEQKHWILDVKGEYAGLSSERENPLLKVSTDIFYFNVMGGWKLNDSFAVIGGFKYLKLEIDLDLRDQLHGHAEPDVWDPMIGVDFRHFANDRVEFKMDLEGGGFGVGTDVDISGNASVDLEFLPHVILNVGYSFLYIKQTIGNVTIGSFQRELEIKQTLHGPRLGLGFRF